MGDGSGKGLGRRRAVDRTATPSPCSGRARARPAPDPASGATAADSGDAAQARAHLQQLLAHEYSHLLTRLTRALQSHDRAVDALHDAYVRLGQQPDIDDVRNPLAYLFRMALNLAENVRLRDLRSVALTPSVVAELPDEAPDPERAVFACVNLDRVHAKLEKLPERRRAIFVARWRDGLPQAEIARCFGVHLRTVQKELRRAEHVLKAIADPT